MSAHWECVCGCGELADECAGEKKNPFGSMQMVLPDVPWFLYREARSSVNLDGQTYSLEDER